MKPPDFKYYEEKLDTTCQSCKKLRKQIRQLKKDLKYVENGEIKARYALLTVRGVADKYYYDLIREIEGVPK